MAKTIRDLGKDEKAFFLTGIVLLILTLMDVVNMVVGNVKATLEAQIEAMNFTDEQLELVDLVIWIGIFAIIISVLFRVLLAIKAIQISKKPTKESLHIVIAVIYLVISVYTLLDGFSNSSVTDILTSISNTVIIAFYVFIANKVRASV